MTILRRFNPARDSFSRRINPATVLLLLYGAASWSITLYVILSGVTLPNIGWSYGGGGSELEKIHPATFLLIAAFPAVMLYDRRFMSSAMRVLFEPSFLFFIIASVSTAAYAILVKQVSAAPFVDTFLSTILVATLTLTMPRLALLRLRTLLDIVILINVVMMFYEFATQQSISGAFFGGPTGEGNGRWSGLLGFPLTAAQILAAYSLITFISSPVGSQWSGVRRLLLSMLALLACLLTGGRTAVAVLIGLLAIYVLQSVARQLMSGRLHRLGLIYVLAGLVVATLSIPILDRIGLFDTLSARVEFDNGSSLARDAVVQILENLSDRDLWLGIDASDAGAIQQSYGLIAIEIAWANFIIICGLVFTVPLFISFCLFFFVFLPKYCAPSILLVGAFNLILTFSYNSIWSKTTALAITVAIAISNMRRDVQLRPMQKP